MKRYIIKDGLPKKPYTIDYRTELNEAQYQAVMAGEGPVLVIAGAGSGKTRTLVYRVARLMEDGIDPSSTLLLTFTRKAAGEMLRRAAMLMDSRCENVVGGTFHSFSNMILRKYAALISFPSNYTILDSADSEDIINLVRSRLGFNTRERRFPKKRTIHSIISKAVNTMSSIEHIVENYYLHFIDSVDDLKRIEDEYRKYKAEKFFLDYDDLLVKLMELLENNEPIRHKLSSTYRYIMVDEYQDTNKLQASIVRNLACAHDNVMAVGDDSQSIYSFRGANFKNIMEFPEIFPGTRIIKLEQNYRSTQPILRFTNTVIDRAREKYTKVLFSHKREGPRPALIMAQDESMQSKFVAQKVLELREEGVGLDEVAVLFRSSYHSFDLEIELNRRNIPFVKVGGFKFIETAHIKDVMAFLRILQNPRDTVSWNRLLLLIEGVGTRTSLRIINRIAANGEAPEKTILAEATARNRANIQRFIEVFKEIAHETYLPAEKIALVVKYYLPYLKSRYDNYPKRMKDLEHLEAIAEKYKDVEQMLTDMALEPPNSSVSSVIPEVKEEEGLLTLSTIHSAKGLEWYTVFIIWALDSRFPSAYALRHEADLEEELRLMYVASTRARENLFISYPINIYDRVMGRVLSKPSRFIDDIGDDILEKWSLAVE